jgi:hypothetical protein
MEIYCADCGCLVERGIRVIPCHTAECCCLNLPTAAPMDITAARIRTAFNDRDLDGLSALLAPEATWGDDLAGEGFCHNRTDIVGRFGQLIAEGVEATVVGTRIGTQGIAVELHVDWPEPEDQRPDLARVWMAFMLTDGLVTAIRGQDDEEAAVAATSN